MISTHDKPSTFLPLHNFKLKISGKTQMKYWSMLCCNGTALLQFKVSIKIFPTGNKCVKLFLSFCFCIYDLFGYRYIKLC